MQPATVIDLFRAGLREHRKPDAFLHKIGERYRPMSSEEAEHEIDLLSGGLLEQGVRPGDRVAILSETRLEWGLADFAILAAAGVTVPVFPTLPEAQIEPLLADSQPVLLFVSDLRQFERLLGFWPRLPTLRTVVLFDGRPPTRSTPGRVIALEELEVAGKRKLERDHQAVEERAAGVRPEHLASLIYTSGTTGEPKGVMLTHGNFAANVVSALRYLDIGPHDTALSHLPLSHVFERMGGLFTCVYAGATVAYAEAMETVLTNLGEVRPTLLISVPRLFELVVERAGRQAAHRGAVARALFAHAHRTALAWSRARQEGRPSPWLAARRALAAATVYRKVRERLGGRIRFMVSGGAPLPPDVGHFFHGAGMPILEGYGLTETSPVVAVNPMRAPRIGTVGLPLPGLEVRLDGDGEILVRGHCVMKGYYRRPAETAEMVDGDGWLHTGDIGGFDERGYLRITDRKKDILITDGGKNVAPQMVEAVLRSVPMVAEAVVVGDRRPHLVALLVPDFESLENFARAEGIAFAGRAELVAHKRVRAAIRREIDQRSQVLAPHERVRRFTLLDRELTMSGGEITPTRKVRRRQVAERWAGVIEAMYGR